ncbi:MAG TPA: cation transporter [Nitriliruptorales bacterium]|nr:cation transporter [Nitriliruptorales bacterium]
MDLSTERITAERSGLLRRARRLALFTVAWNVAEGAVAITAALLAGSQALFGFGADSVIESISASVLTWRLTAERRDPHRAEEVEHTALRAIGVSFLLLAAFVAFDAVRALVVHDEPTSSPVGIALTLLSLIVMPWLAVRKRRMADALVSRAAVADSQQTWACAWLSAVVLTGLVLNATLGWWWADPVAALGVAVLLVREGREALSAERLDVCC